VTDSSRRTILLLGASGQVGTAVAAALPDGWDLVRPTTSEVDLRRPEETRAVVRTVRPSAIVNAAAYTAVDRAEVETELAQVVNVEAPALLAAEAAKIGALLVHYSTDYVFDGRARTPYRESDSTNPLSVYGRTKRDGEEAVLAAGGRAIVVRTSWVYARRGSNFLVTMRRLFREQDAVRVVDDQVGAPTTSHHIAAATWSILEADPGADHAGIYHFTASGAASWCGFARAILELDRSEDVRCRSVDPIATDEYPTAAVRPIYSVLDCSLIEAVFGIRPVPWEVQLREVMDFVRGSGRGSSDA
jgi:dTDP-4-dehydrorhamnose reductase